MKPSPLTALSPLDGRYADALVDLRPSFSEYGFIRYRLLVEIRWLIFIAQQPNLPHIPTLSKDAVQYLETLLNNFNEDEALKVKAIENTTRHDVKAIEYYLKEAIKAQSELHAVSEFIHFACTSEDINNIAYALMVKEAKENTLLPAIDTLVAHIDTLAKEHAALPMLSRTHGQPASPTTLGKEMIVFASRLQRQRRHIANTENLAKINGAVGNFNAHHVAYPDCDWPQLAQSFIEQLGLTYNPLTTQIESHDAFAELFDACARFNTILIDFNRDIWSYISLGYFKQRTAEGQVGSSTMPHKINPIDFENSEGNLGLANAQLSHLSRKLSLSRWQRDLTDSTTLRNIGVAFGHCVLAYQNCLKGLKKLDADAAHIQNDLQQHWALLAEPIQTILRREGVDNPYEQLKALTQGKTVDRARLAEFIAALDIDDTVKNTLTSLSPDQYIGLAESLALTDLTGD